MAKTVAAYAWLQREDWPQWIAADPMFEPSYETWLAKSEARIKEFEKRGTGIEKVTVRFDEFICWAKANRRAVDTKARSEFAAMLLMRSRDKGH